MTKSEVWLWDEPVFPSNLHSFHLWPSIAMARAVSPRPRHREYAIADDGHVGQVQRQSSAHEGGLDESIMQDLEQVELIG